MVFAYPYTKLLQGLLGMKDKIFPTHYDENAPSIASHFWVPKENRSLPVAED